MKFRLLIPVIILFTACENDGDNPGSVKKNPVKTVLSSDYEYLQNKNSAKAQETLIIAIDPHGDGKFALSKFAKISDYLDCTIIGLNDVENNQTDFMQTIEKNIKTAEKNLHLNVKRIFVAGFSGGARMAFQYGLKHPVNGVLMCGAGINMQNASSLKFPLAMIIGTKDFNFIEQYYSPYSPIVNNKNILTLLFDGIHEWPPEDDLLSAIIFLSDKTGINSEFNNRFIEKGDEYVKSENYFEAFKNYETAFKSGILEGEEKLGELLKNHSFKNFITQYEASLQKEIERNNNYMNDLDSKSLNFWHNRIYTISKLMNSKDKIEADSYARTKSYLGIAMYSFVGREINNPWSKKIDKYLKIYEYLEPENPDMCFFNSIREKQKNNLDLSREYLKRAFLFGFRDSLKAKQYGLMNE